MQGMGAGLFAGIPQVLTTQVEAWLLGLARERADIGPRFVQRLARRLGESFPTSLKWALAAAFHFGYAAWWGGSTRWSRSCGRCGRWSAARCWPG